MRLKDLLEVLSSDVDIIVEDKNGDTCSNNACYVEVKDYLETIVTAITQYTPEGKDCVTLYIQIDFERGDE